MDRSSLPLCFFLLLLPVSTWTLPLCTDSRAPFEVNSTLKFCSYSGKTCCDSTDDSDLQKRFQSMNISDTACSSVIKSILCAKCDPFSGDLFTISSVPRPVPALCNSSGPSNSSQTTKDFCSKTWESCQTVPILNSPFAPSLQGRAGPPVNSTATRLTDLWQSKTDFCNAFGGLSTNNTLCFTGEPIELNKTGLTNPPHGLCLEKIGNGTYLTMAAHPDGSNRAFFATQQGQIFLSTLPDQDSGLVMDLDASNPFLDLTDEVHYDTEFGLMGMAFHPNFAQNGRLFASFNCDKVKSPGCIGRCSCNSDVNCDPSKLPSDNGAAPCQYQTVIAEYTANGTDQNPSSAKNGRPGEVRRILTMGLPFTSQHGGQILFGPSDGYLYVMMGDGGGGTDPFNFAQNKKSLLGKIMRLDVDNFPSESEISKLGLWGNYSIPKDNPFREDKELQPEIWALGMRNPWRCSFDSHRPSYFMCADVGQDAYEEVDIITKGGNYGWRIYEGRSLFKPTSSPGGNTSEKSIKLIFPVMGYNHSEVNKNEGSASITGGYFYRSQTDPCTYGTYLYADLYAGGMWAGTENPENSGTFTTTKIPFRCAGDSPIKCVAAPGGGDSSDAPPSLGYIFSFGEDNKKDVFLLTTSGVYRVVRPSRCRIGCAVEKSGPATGPAARPGGSSSPSGSNRLAGFRGSVGGLMFFTVLLLLSL